MCVKWIPSKAGGERLEDGDGTSLLCQLKGRKLVGFACVFGGGGTYRQATRFVQISDVTCQTNGTMSKSRV